MNYKNKIVLALATTTSIVGISFAAYAIDEDIGASAQFREALSLANVTAMEYGLIEYSAQAANDIELDANGGTITCSNTADYTCPATGTVGSVDINGTTAAVVEITCEQTGTIGDGVNSLPLNSAELRINGADVACTGLTGTAAPLTLSAGTDTVTVGATLAIPAAGILAPGTYDTANGDPIAVRVLYQ